MPTKKKRQSKKPDGDGIPKEWHYFSKSIKSKFRNVTNHKVNLQFLLWRISILDVHLMYLMY